MPATKEKITEEQAIQLLKKAFGRDKVGFRSVLKHSRAVQKAALRIAGKNQAKGVLVDIPFIKTSCLLHDIGRAKCPPWSKSSIQHGVKGARLLRSEHLLRHARVAERHIGAGLTPFEAKKLKLPVKDYRPKTTDEKIVTHADKLVDMYKIRSFDWAYAQCEKELGKKVAWRMQKLRNQVDM